MIQLSFIGETPEEEVEEVRALIGGAVPADIFSDVAELQEKVAALENEIIVNLVTGQEVATNEFIDGKRVYCKTVNVGALPVSGNKNVHSGLNMANIKIVRLEGIAINRLNSGTTIMLPNATPNNVYSIGCFVTAGGYVQVGVNMDRSDYDGIVRIYYTKEVN